MLMIRVGRREYTCNKGVEVQVDDSTVDVRVTLRAPAAGTCRIETDLHRKLRRLSAAWTA